MGGDASRHLVAPYKRISGWCHDDALKLLCNYRGLLLGPSINKEELTRLVRGLHLVFEPEIWSKSIVRASSNPSSPTDRIIAPEFLAGVAITAGGRLEQKIGLVFSIFDFDSTSSLLFHEMVILLLNIINAINSFTNKGWPNALALNLQVSEHLAKDAFALYNKCETDKLTQDEFEIWVCFFFGKSDISAITFELLALKLALHSHQMQAITLQSMLGTELELKGVMLSSPSQEINKGPKEQATKQQATKQQGAHDRDVLQRQQPTKARLEANTKIEAQDVPSSQREAAANDSSMIPPSIVEIETVTAEPKDEGKREALDSDKTPAGKCSDSESSDGKHSRGQRRNKKKSTKQQNAAQSADNAAAKASTSGHANKTGLAQNANGSGTGSNKPSGSPIKSVGTIASSSSPMIAASSSSRSMIAASSSPITSASSSMSPIKLASGMGPIKLASSSMSPIKPGTLAKLVALKTDVLDSSESQRKKREQLAAYKLERKLTKKCQEMFDAMDMDKDGVVTKEDLRAYYAQVRSYAHPFLSYRACVYPVPACALFLPASHSIRPFTLCPLPSTYPPLDSPG
jgi:Ca2+-binding EF-hand superfamily protein